MVKIFTVIYILICLLIAVVILLQEGKQAGLGGTISGAAETYWGKNKGRSMEGKQKLLSLYSLFYLSY